jgi:hypothetical protein
MDIAIENVANYFHWTPQTINEMYCDNIDILGILYWNKVVEKNQPKTK